MPSIFLAALLAAPAVSAPVKTAEKSAASDDEKFVDYFLKTDTGELNPALIPRFMALDLEKIPAKKRDGVAVKRLELKALRKSAEAKTKPPIRRAGAEPLDKCAVEEGGPDILQKLRIGGFVEITDSEERFVMEKTKCTECELVEEFTLTRVAVHKDPKKKGRPEGHIFLHSKDVLMALVAQYRDGGKGGTNFFSIGFFGACR